VARCLIIGCGCRGRLLAAALVKSGHPVRGTTRDPGRLRAIEAAGAEAVVGDPDRVSTLMPALDHVSVVILLLGSAEGSRAELEALHGPRLEMLLTKLTDTTMRGIVYEARGRAPAELLERGAGRVRAFARDTRAGYELLESDPDEPVAWAAQSQAAVERILTA
jgi:threonine dehydrogenase-like Zn-dependent dehydrogenase